MRFVTWTIVAAPAPPPDHNRLHVAKICLTKADCLHIGKQHLGAVPEEISLASDNYPCDENEDHERGTNPQRDAPEGEEVAHGCLTPSPSKKFRLEALRGSVPDKRFHRKLSHYPDAVAVAIAFAMDVHFNRYEFVGAGTQPSTARFS